MGSEVTIFTNMVLQTIILLTECFIMVSLFVFLFWVNWYPTLVVTAILGVFATIFYQIFRKKITILGKARQYHSGQVTQQALQALGGIKEIKILAKEKHFVKMFLHHVEGINRASRSQQMIQLTPRFIIEVLMISVVLTIMNLLLLNDQEPEKVLVTISVFAVAAIRMMPSINKIIAALSTIRYSAISLEVIYQEIQRFPEAKVQNNEVLQGHSDELQFKNTLELRNIEYQYPGEKDKAIRGISLTIPQGKMVGFVGASGAGKTTTIDLILGLFEPTSGDILIDGHSILENPFDWQKKIGYIPQSIYLSDETISKNIAFGVSENQIQEDQVWNSVRLAQLEEFIKTLPHGLDTMVGEHGDRVSGGQRQRIGIARSLYYNPEVLVMDEATAALDNETEKALMQSIENLSGKKTIIIIAHRFTTVQNCDIIYFMKEGRIQGSGTFNELLKNNEEFKKLALA